MKVADVLDATLTPFNVQAVNTPYFCVIFVRLVRPNGEYSTVKVQFQGSTRFASRDSKIKKCKVKRKEPQDVISIAVQWQKA